MSVLVGQATEIALRSPSDAGSSRAAWMQVACVGSFFSRRYGPFTITVADLRQMLHNFQDVTPIAPTQLPVDFDHLSMDPQKPGDGKAAGWITALELRDGDTELWARVEFTPDAADAIRKKEYRFVSPSFVKDYVWKNGKNIGTTLIAAAITNHPFLEGMAAITLTTFGETTAGGKSAMVPGQKVSITREAIRYYPHLDRAITAQALEVEETSGAGDQAFALLKTAAGVTIGWFPIWDLEPARAAPGAAADGVMLALATSFQRDHPGTSLGDAIRQIGKRDPDVSIGYWLTTRRPPVSTNRLDGAATQFATLVHVRATADRLPMADAVRLMAREQPSLAEAWRLAARR